MRINKYTENTNRLEKEVRKYQPLTAEENIALFKQYNETKDIKIRDSIFNGNMRLIFTVTNQYVGLFDMTKEELFNIASIGMIQAIQLFNVESGNKFSSYARMAIINELNNEGRRNGNLIRKRTSVERDIKDGKLQEYNYISTNQNNLNSDDTTIGDMLINDDIPFDETIDDINDRDKERLFWETVKESGLKEQYYDICRAIWSANTETGCPIKVTSQSIGEMYGTTKQNIQIKKDLIKKKLAKNPKLYKFWKDNFFDY